VAETFTQPVVCRVKKHHSNVLRSFSTSKNVSTKHCVERCMNGINVSWLLALVCTANHFWVNRSMWRCWTYELLLRNTACRPLLSGGRPRKRYKWAHSGRVVQVFAFLGQLHSCDLLRHPACMSVVSLGWWGHRLLSDVLRVCIVGETETETETVWSLLNVAAFLPEYIVS
jgi:hypothetical protein